MKVLIKMEPIWLLSVKRNSSHSSYKPSSILSNFSPSSDWSLYRQKKVLHWIFDINNLQSLLSRIINSKLETNPFEHMKIRDVVSIQLVSDGSKLDVGVEVEVTELGLSFLNLSDTILSLNMVLIYNLSESQVMLKARNRLCQTTRALKEIEKQTSLQSR